MESVLRLLDWLFWDIGIASRSIWLTMVLCFPCQILNSLSIIRASLCLDAYDYYSCYQRVYDGFLSRDHQVSNV